MESKKVIAVTAKLIRKSGFKGKIDPKLEVCQLWISSAVYSDICYSVRMEGVFPAMYVYKLVDGVWKPIRKSGVIVEYFDILHYEERKDYKNYYEYFSYYKYDQFADEWSMLSNVIDEVTIQIKKEIK